MLEILHNNRCGKSRAAIQFLEEHHLDYKIRLYLENPLSELEIKELLKKLDLNIHKIIRKNEEIWKEKFSEKSYSDEELIEILASNPKLLQRPIIIKGSKAFIAREPEKFNLILL